jgi:hypothetical protein
MISKLLFPLAFSAIVKSATAFPVPNPWSADKVDSYWQSNNVNKFTDNVATDTCEALPAWRTFKGFEEMAADAVDQAAGTIRLHYDVVNLKDVLTRVPKQFRGRLVVVCTELIIDADYNLEHALVVEALNKITVVGDRTLHIIPETTTHIRLQTEKIEGGKLLLSSQHVGEGTFCQGREGEEYAVQPFVWENMKRDGLKQLYIDGLWNGYTRDRRTAKSYPEFLVQNPWGIIDDRAEEQYPRQIRILKQLPHCSGTRRDYTRDGLRPILCIEKLNAIDTKPGFRLFVNLPLPRDKGGVFAQCNAEENGQCGNVNFCRGRTNNLELMRKAWDDGWNENPTPAFEVAYDQYSDLINVLMDMTKSVKDGNFANLQALESRVGKQDWWYNQNDFNNYLSKTYVSKVLNFLAGVVEFWLSAQETTEFGSVPMWPQRDTWITTDADKAEFADMAGLQGWLKYTCVRGNLNWDIVSTAPATAVAAFDELRAMNIRYAALKTETTAMLDGLIGQIQSTLALQSYMYSDEVLIPRFSPDEYVKSVDRMVEVATSYQTNSLVSMDRAKSVDARFSAVEAMRAELRTASEVSKFAREQLAGKIKDSQDLLSRYIDKMDAAYSEMPALQQKLEDGLSNYEFMEGLRAMTKIVSMAAKKKDWKIIGEALIPTNTIAKARPEVKKVMQKYNKAGMLVQRTTLGLDTTSTQLQSLYDSTAAVIASADPFGPLPTDDKLRQHLLNVSNSFNIEEIAGYSRAYEELAETGTMFISGAINKDVNGAVDYKANMITITIVAKAVAQEMTLRAKMVQEYVAAVYAEVLQKQTLALWERDSKFAREQYVNSINVGFRTLQNEFLIKEYLFGRLQKLCDSVFFSTTVQCPAKSGQVTLNYGSSLSDVIAQVNRAVMDFKTTKPSAADGIRQETSGIVFRFTEESYLADLKARGRVTIPWAGLSGDLPSRLDFEGKWGICARRVNVGLIGSTPIDPELNVVIRLIPSVLNVQRNNKMEELRAVTSLPPRAGQISYDFSLVSDSTQSWPIEGYTMQGEIFDPKFQYYCGSSLRDWTIELSSDANLDLTGLKAIDLSFDIVSYSQQ